MLLIPELLWPFGFAFVFLALVSIWHFLRSFPARFRSMRSANWRIADGRVETVTVSGFAEQSLAQAAYSYLVDGDRYAGYFSRQFADEKEAWDYLSPLKGQSLFVRYNPARPEVSAVRIADQNGLFFARQKNFVLGFLNRWLLQGLDLDDWKSLRAWNPRHRPITKGRIEFATVAQKRVEAAWGLLPYYLCEIQYSYAVQGEYHSGCLERTFLRESAAQKLADELKGKEVFIRYRAESPEDSILLREDQQGVRSA